MESRKWAKSNAGFLVSIYVIFLILTPIVKAGIGVPLRLDDIFLLFLIAVMPINSFLRPSFLNIVMLCFCLSCFVSLVAGLAGGSAFSFSSANDVFVAVRLFLVVAVVQYYVRTTENIHQIFMWLYRAICISAVVAALQYFRIQPFDIFLVNLYSQGGEKYLSGLAGYIPVWRVVSTYGNPNYAGLFFVIGAIFSVHMIDRRLRDVVIHGVVLVALTMLCVISLSSRTSLVLLVLCFFLYNGISMYINKFSLRRFFKMSVVLILILILSFSIYQIVPKEAFTTRIKEFLNMSTSTLNMYDILIQSRGVNWANTIGELRNQNLWLFGVGPRPEFVVDSGYMYVLYTQGTVGLSLILLLWIWPVLTLRKIRPGPSGKTAAYVITILMGSAIFAVVAPVFFHPKVGPIVAVFLGMWQVLLKESKRSLKIGKIQKA